MGINGGRGINSGLVLGGSGINIAGGGTPPFAFGNALQFDGVNDYVTSIGSFDDGSKNFGFSCWFKTTNTATITNRVANPIIGDRDSFWRTAVGFNGGKVSTMSFNGTIIQYSEGSNNYADGNWHCMTVIRNRNGSDLLGLCSIYVDGVTEINSQPFDVDSTYKFNAIGASRPTDCYEGVLDEFVGYSGIGLSVNISSNQEFYNSGNGKLATEVFSDIVTYYRFNQTSPDATAQDSSGNENTGTLNNFNTATCWVAH